VDRENEKAPEKKDRGEKTTCVLYRDDTGVVRRK
jgi:hypothetical protein